MLIITYNETYKLFYLKQAINELLNNVEVTKDKFDYLQFSYLYSNVLSFCIGI